MLVYIHQFFEALVFSGVTEAVVVLLLCVVLKKNARTMIATASVAFFGTAATIPYVWFVFPTIFWYSSTLSLYFAEGFAFFAEALLYKFIGKLSLRQALVFSLVANSVSFVVPLLFHFGF